MKSRPFIYPAVAALYSGTRYLVSDTSIATVTEDGLVTALSTGQVTLSIVHLAAITGSNGQIVTREIGQTDIPLLVTLPQPVSGSQQVTIDASQGGVVQASSGETVMIGAGALNEDSAVGIARIALADLEAVAGLALPGNGRFTPLGAFQLDLATNGAQLPVQLAIPLQNTPAAEAGDEVLFFRRGTVFGLDGQLHDTWWLVDNGFIGADGIARTASPPYGGISIGGSFLMIKEAGAAPREVTLVSLNPDDFATVFDYGFSLAGVMLNLAGIIASNAV